VPKSDVCVTSVQLLITDSSRTSRQHTNRGRAWVQAQVDDRPANVRFGSKADVTLLNFDVRFTPKSGHSPTRSGCLLWAISRLMRCSEKGYSMTSSAISRKSREIVRRSAFAVLRLITSSNLVGCSTGRSEGFAPLRILATIAPSCSHIAGRLGPSGFRMFPPLIDRRKPILGSTINDLPVK
jgi:hypothetical protein